MALSLIALIGTLLRLLSIDTRGLWGDEAVRVYAARLPSALDVLHVVWAQPPSAPIYWLGLHWWILLFGHSDVAVRLFSVIPSALAIPAIFLLGSRVAGVAVGVVASMLMAVAPLAVEVGEEATMYALSMLLVTLLLACSLPLIRLGCGAFLYVLTGTLLLYTHYMGTVLLALLSIGGTSIIRSRYSEPRASGVIRRWLKANALIYLLWLPWAIAISVRFVERWGEMAQLQYRAGLAELYDAFLNLLVSASASRQWPAWMLVGTTVVALLLSAVSLIRAAGIERAVLGLLVWITGGFILFIIAFSAFTGEWLYQPRFMALILPCALVVLASVIRSFGALYWTHLLKRSQMGSVLLPLGGVAAWLLIQLAGLRQFYVNPVHGRDGLREIGAQLTAKVQKGDIVLANQPMLVWFAAQYYDGPAAGLPQSWDIRDGYPLLPPRQPDWVTLQEGALQQQTIDSRRVWLLYLPFVDPAGRLISQISVEHRLIEHSSYPLADLYLFDAATESPSGSGK